MIEGDRREKWVVIKGLEGDNPSSTSAETVMARTADLKFRAHATYTATASELIIVDRLKLTGGPFTVNFSMKISTIENDGNVTADIFIGGRKGTMAGRIDAVSGLQLTGILNDSYNATHEATLIAAIKDGSLTTGKYVLRSGATTVTGEFQF